MGFQAELEKCLVDGGIDLAGAGRNHDIKVVDDVVGVMEQAAEILHAAGVGFGAVLMADCVFDIGRQFPLGQCRGAEFGMIAVSGWVSSFLARYPEVHVELDYTGRIVDIVHEGFDLAIRVGPLPDSSLSARKLGELRYALFASPSYLARHPAPQTVAALREHALLMFTTGTQRSEWKLQCGDAEVRIDGPSRLRVNNGFTLREACLRGLGIARLPWLLAADAHARGELLVLLPEWQLPSVPIHAVYASARYLAPKVRAFIDHAVAEFAQRETGH